MLEQYIENNYLRFGALLILSFIALRASVWILEKIILKITVRTKTDLDDIIIEKTSKPLTWLVLFVGLKIALDELMLVENVQNIIHKSVNSIIFIIIFYMAYVVIMLIINKSWKRYSKKTSIRKNEGLFHLIEGTLKVVLIISAFLILLNSWGVEIGPLLAGLGIGGIAIAFALQSTLGNIFSGVAIILDKSIRVNDVVNLPDGTNGKIMKIGLRSTKIKTFDNEIVIVPNSTLANSNIHNVAQPEPKSRVVIPFGVGYGSDVEKVKKIVLSEIKKINGVENPEEAHVKFLEMADSSLNFKAYFFVKSFEKRLGAIDEANTRIYNILNKNKIEIPFPQMDVNLKK